MWALGQGAEAAGLGKQVHVVHSGLRYKEAPLEASQTSREAAGRRSWGRRNLRGWCWAGRGLWAGRTGAWRDGEVTCRWWEGASSPGPPAVGLGGHPRSHQARFPGTVGLPPAVCPSSLFFIPRFSPLFCLLFYVEMPALRTGLFWAGEPSSPRVGRVLAGKASPSGGSRGPRAPCLPATGVGGVGVPLEARAAPRVPAVSSHRGSCLVSPFHVSKALALLT